MRATKGFGGDVSPPPLALSRGTPLYPYGIAFPIFPYGLTEAERNLGGDMDVFDSGSSFTLAERIPFLLDSERCPPRQTSRVERLNAKEEPLLT